MSDFDEDVVAMLNDPSSLGEWVMGKVEEWRDHYDANYKAKHDEYFRLFRAKWAEEDKTRESERSRLIAPALRQAVESAVADIETATFGRKFFDIRDDAQDPDPRDVAAMRKQLTDDLKLAGVRADVGECLLVGAIFGTGIGEIDIHEIETTRPGSRPGMENLTKEVGVYKEVRLVQKLNPVQPRNFAIDPVATCVQSAMGCAVDQYVSLHEIVEKQESGIYRDDVEVGTAADVEELLPDPFITKLPTEKVRVTRYYGKVPTAYLALQDDVDEDMLDMDKSYTEAIVIVANGDQVLKAMANPYMSGQRPIVAFQWDVVPGCFWGVGICEKGYHPQKALDAEMRARIDALALTTHPMMAANALMFPKGTKLNVRPGRTFMVQGDPRQGLMPLKFGEVGQITFAQADALQKMVSQATGAVDTGTLQAGAASDARTGAVSMSLGGMVKRQARTLVNFQEKFLIPMLKHMACTYMQFNPEKYPAKDYDFVIDASLSVVARELEQQQLTQVLQSLPPESPAHSAVLKGLIDMMDISSREEIIALIEKANEPNPEAQKQAQEAHEQQMQFVQSQIGLLQAQSAESQSRANKYNVEAQLAPQELALEYSDADKDGKVDAEFEKKMRLGDLMLRQKEVEAKQYAAKESAKAKAEAELIRRLTERSGAPEPTVDG